MLIHNHHNNQLDDFSGNGRSKLKDKSFRVGIPSFLEGFVPGKQNAELYRGTRLVNDPGNLERANAEKIASQRPAPTYGGGYGYNAAAAAAAQQAALARQQAENEINFGYNDYIDRDLNNLIEMSQFNQNQALGGLNTRYGTEQGTLRSKLDRTLAGLGNSREDVRSAQKSSLSDVARDYARKLQGGGLMLSNRGASDSSATRQLGLGLAGAQAQSRGDVLGQANTQFGNIGLQEAGANSDFGEQQRLLDDWKNNEEQNVFSQYNNFRTQIEREKAGANLERSQALANMDKALAGTLSSRLANFQSNFTQMSKQLADSLAGSNPNLSPTAINQTYTAQPINRQSIPGLSFGDVSPQVQNLALTPQLSVRKKDDTGV